MITTNAMHAISAASAQCAAAKPNQLIGSSAAAGWTSLLLDHHEGSGHSETFETNATADLTLVVATAGRHRIEALAQGRWRSALYQAGSGGMTPPGETARLRWHTPSPQRSFRTLHAYLPGSLVEAIMDEYRRIGQATAVDCLSALAFRDEAIVAQMGALLIACRGGEPDLYAAGAAHWMVTHLLSRQAGWRHVVDGSRSAATITDRRLARVIEYMSVHLAHSLTLPQLAREAGISVHHFGRRFRECVGMGPAAYLTTLRIERARLLLTTTDLAIADVALQCGYPRASTFSTAFLRHVGVTPRAWRTAR